MRFSQIDFDMPESLWALGTDGMLWQINPFNCSAAPVLKLDELPLQERRNLQRHMLLHWSKPRATLMETALEKKLQEETKPKNGARGNMQLCSCARCSGAREECCKNSRRRDQGSDG